MRAWVLDRQAPIESSPLVLRELPEPRPGSGEVLLGVSACGICRTDLHVVEGDLPPRRLPIVPGHQIVGRVLECGPGVAGVRPGERVGAAWLHRSCGACRFCRTGRENLCENPDFTGWTRDGGFAERVRVPADFCYPIPEGFSDLEAAPLLCAGIIGYRALRLAGVVGEKGIAPVARLGIYGFGAAGHVAIQVARARGVEVFVMTRDRERHQALARELGAAWVGGTLDPPPATLDAAIVFAPAGEIVPAALAALDRGGALVLAGIYMSPTPPIAYESLYQERVIRSVANNTRRDGREFLAEAARIPVRTAVQVFSFAEVNQALAALKNDAIRGSGVIRL